MTNQGATALTAKPVSIAGGRCNDGQEQLDPVDSRAWAARPRHIALVGNALPRLCGLATYSSHVHEALLARFPDVVIDHYAMVDPGRSYAFPSSVRDTIQQEDPESYIAAARAIRASGADLLWVQHEFGIYGGRAGSLLFELLDRTRTPVVVTLHTVLTEPAPDQRQVLVRLAGRASLLIVMAEHARGILRDVYHVPDERIAVIPHGVPDRCYVSPSSARRRLGLEDRKTILTFGLLSPGKGIETMIQAMPAILKRCPETRYLIVGATHPHLVACEGEAYRERLQGLARTLGVADHLRWDSRFLDEETLLDHIQAADIYVTPYRNAAQITSGTLSYALGLGKPIVSTPYVHARELLADGRGRIVGFDDVVEMARAVGAWLSDDLGRRQTAGRAYASGRAMTWQCTIEQSMAKFERLLADRAAKERSSETPGKSRNPAATAVCLGVAA